MQSWILASLLQCHMILFLLHTHFLLLLLLKLLWNSINLFLGKSFFDVDELVYVQLADQYHKIKLGDEGLVWPWKVYFVTLTLENWT